MPKTPKSEIPSEAFEYESRLPAGAAFLPVAVVAVLFWTMLYLIS